MADDDEGFYGYVPNTINPGPILLVATITIGVFIFVTLPIAVIIGDKYEELERKTHDNKTDDDDAIKEEEQQQDEGSDQQHGRQHREAREENVEVLSDDASLESEGTIYSAISGAFKEMLEQKNGKVTNRKYRNRRHRRRQMAHGGGGSWEENRQEKPPPHIDVSGSWDTKSDRGGTLDKTHGNNLKENRDGDKVTGFSVSTAGSVRECYQPSKCSVSDCGRETKAVAVSGHRVFLENDDGNNRNVCLTVDGFLDEFAAIMAWDYEMKRIIKLSIPFATQAIFTGAMDIMTVAVVGKLIGTNEVSAFVVVNLIIELTTEFCGGFHRSLVTCCSQALGNGKNRLAGKYVQIATLFYILSYMPFAILWVFYLDAAIEWFGFNAEVVRIGTQYGYVLLVDYLIDGIGEAIHALLDVTGFEHYSTFIGAVEELLAFVTILVWALVGNPSLLVVGLVQFGMGAVFLVLNIAIIWWKGWFLPYRSGMIGGCALTDRKAVWLVCKTAMSLSFGYLLTDGEWEILTVFAGFLGPAEVAAWGIFGAIWDAIHELIDGLANASEVRCAFLLGSGQPHKARLSAYKSLMICVFSSLLVTSGLYIAGDDLPTWFTNDPTLQHLLRDLLPMFGLANATLSLGTMCWTLLGSQGRYRLATTVVLVVSWCITLPLSAVFSIYLKINLEGQTTAVVIGYMISGALHAYFLFRSDWVGLSKIVMDDNDSRASDYSAADDVPLGTPPITPPAPQTAPSTESPTTPNLPTVAQSQRLPRRPSGVGDQPVAHNREKSSRLPRRPSGGGDQRLQSQTTGIVGNWTGAPVNIEIVATRRG